MITGGGEGGVCSGSDVRAKLQKKAKVGKKPDRGNSKAL